LSTGALTHDDCQITGLHVANSRRAAKHGATGRYILEKGSSSQKIDAAVASVVAHEAAARCKRKLWSRKPNNTIRFV
jgi:phage terminase large subunit-like protein